MLMSAHLHTSHTRSICSLAHISHSHNLLTRRNYDSCMPFAPTIPGAAFALFQMLFASITPLLMTGSIVGRMRFWPWLTFTLLWEVLCAATALLVLMHLALLCIMSSRATQIPFTRMR
jgi:ammonia channel protein AmtB